MTDTITVPDPDLNHMVELLIEQSPEGQVDSTVAVRWCIDPRLAEYLRAHPGEQPWLVISDFAHIGGTTTQEMLRWLVPLDQLMTYISFRRPGKHTLAAFVLLGSRPNVERRVLSKHSHHSYENMLFGDHYHDTAQSLDERLNRVRIEVAYGDFGDAVLSGMKVASRVAELDVEVPKGLFAKEPPKWVRNYVGIFFKYRPEDQCHLRKRMIFTGPLLPFVASASFLLRLVALIWSLLAAGRCYPKYLLKPFSTHIKSTSVELDEIEEKWESKPWTAPGFWLVVVPCMLLLLATLIMNWRWTLLGMAVLACIFVYAYGRTEYKKRTKKQQDSKSRSWQLKDDAFQALICQPGNDYGASLSALPRNKRTVKLRFANLKTKVCRPFAS